MRHASRSFVCRHIINQRLGAELLEATTMSRRIKTLSGSLAIAVVAVTIAAASAADVLQNGGFEIGGGAPAAWTITQTAAPLGDFNGDNTVDAADYVMWRKGG